jgi:hypothetical protein
MTYTGKKTIQEGRRGNLLGPKVKWDVRFAYEQKISRIDASEMG